MADCMALSDCDSAAIEKLLDAAFGADRKQRTAYMVRKGVDPLPTLSFGLVEESNLVGCIQCWPVAISGLQGPAFPLILVGPVAVSPTHQNKGLGHILMHRTLDAAALHGNPVMVMIGDPEYYERFGFFAGPGKGWQLPGPWEPRRLLVRNRYGAILPSHGVIGPDISYAL